MQKKTILAYFLVYTIWSSTYIAIKASVAWLPTFTFVGIRWFFSGLIMLVIALTLEKKHGLGRRQVLHSMLLGILLLSVSNGLLSESEKIVDSYVAAITFAITPILMIIFDWVINKEKVKMSIIPAIILGITGIAILDYVPGSGIVVGPGTVLLLVSLTSWSFASALSHRLSQPAMFSNLAIQMLTAGAFAFIVSAAQGNGLPSGGTPAAMISVIYLITFGSIGMLAYSYLLKHEPLSRVSSYTFVNPVGAVLLSFLFGEPVSSSFIIALPLILLGLYLMMRSRHKEKHMEAEAER